jgi:hypothetical protein
MQQTGVRRRFVPPVGTGGRSGHLRWGVIAAAAWSLGFPIQRDVTVEVDLGRWAAEATCRVERVGAGETVSVVAASPTLRWVWRSGDTLRCDAPGAEPLDVVLRDPPVARFAVTLADAARTVRLMFARPEPIVLEWREEATGGSRRVAERAVGPAPIVMVPLAAPARLLRVRRPEGSPVSMRFPAGRDEAEVRVPPGAPGGELLAILPARIVMPRAVQLDGPSGRREAPVEDGWFAAWGLGPGRYRVAPLYDGDITGEPVEVLVQAGETTELWPLQLPLVGGAEIALSSELCREELLPAQLLVRRLRQVAPRSVRFETAWEREVPEAQCRFVLGGLTAGRYDVTLSSARRTMGAHASADASRAAGPVASADFEVREEAVTSVALEVPAVIVQGQVRFEDGRPAAELLVSFEFRDRLAVETMTDALGMYTAALPEPGRYRVGIGTWRYLGLASFVRTFERGTQRADFTLRPGVLRLHVRTVDGGPPSEPVQVEIDPVEGGQQRGGHGGFLTPELAGELELVGLALGRYRVSASTSGGWVTDQPSLVELTARAPVADVDLWLNPPVEGTLRVADEAGVSIAGATVQAGSLLLRELEPGRFQLTRAPSGTHVYVTRQGYVPACRVWPGRDARDLVVRLVWPVAGAVFRFRPPVPVPLGVVAGLPESDCAVGLSRFDYRLETTGRETVVEVSNFPAGRFVLQVMREGRPVEYPFVVPGNPVTIRDARDLSPARAAAADRW